MVQGQFSRLQNNIDGLLLPDLFTEYLTPRKHIDFLEGIVVFANRVMVTAGNELHATRFA